MTTRQLMFRDGVSTYALSAPIWGSGTVTYHIAYVTEHPVDTCHARLTLVWTLPSGWAATVFRGLLRYPHTLSDHAFARYRHARLAPVRTGGRTWYQFRLGPWSFVDLLGPPMEQRRGADALALPVESGAAGHVAHPPDPRSWRRGGSPAWYWSAATHVRQAVARGNRPAGRADADAPAGATVRCCASPRGPKQGRSACADRLSTARAKAANSTSNKAMLTVEAR